MVVGFDVYHCGKRRGSSVGAMVAAKHGSYSKTYSVVKAHTSNDELSAYMATGIQSELSIQNIPKRMANVMEFTF